MSVRMKLRDRAITFRLLEIEQLIKSGRPYGVKELAERLEVSPRTIQRDLEAMRDLLGAPLVYDRRRKSYTYEREFNLPKPSLTRNEISALFLVDKLLKYLEGTPYAGELASACEKVQLLLMDRLESGPEGEAGFISIAGESLRGDELKLAETFKILEEGRRQGRPVEISHYSVQRGTLSGRILEPYHLHLWKGGWYVIGFCHLRREIRMFALDRIRTARLVEGQFEVPQGFDIDEYLQTCWGIERGDPVGVKVRFDRHQAKWIRERRWHPSQRLTELADGGVIFEAEVNGLREIKEWILGFGRHAEVLGPEALREEIREEIEGMREMYG